MWKRKVEKKPVWDGDHVNPKCYFESIADEEAEAKNTVMRVSRKPRRSKMYNKTTDDAYCTHVNDSIFHRSPPCSIFDNTLENLLKRFPRFCRGFWGWETEKSVMTIWFNNAERLFHILWLLLSECSAIHCALSRHMR